MNNAKLVSLLTLVFFTCVNTEPLVAQTEKTNFIVVLIDDMGWSDLSCFGNQAVQTENIDRLAKEGIRFTNFYVYQSGTKGCQPIVAPS